ncbi:MAG: hypothetical protein DI564_12545 [Rhodanobacter denitrificans]|uniref:Uncharacterized protein n=1 Tax=Rhodanobacter denitrificans TaxID=666685 RepID=A0A2W5LZT0_9GAMM|nr:MAG: hypothetical protein DI564_12545 [Rhodanobacter denitrificans]
MKFAVTTSKLFYESIDEIERLSTLGFHFRPALPHAPDDDMPVPMRIGGRPTIQLTAMAALIALARDHGGRITLDAHEQEIMLLNGG